MPVSKVLAFEAGLHQYLDSAHGELIGKINEKGDWNNDLEAALKAGITAFKKTFA